MRNGWFSWLGSEQCPSPLESVSARCESPSLRGDCGDERGAVDAWTVVLVLAAEIN